MSAPLGSKANPSKFEVYKDLPDDEPYFVIRARDPLSSALVELHAYIGAGQSGSAHNKLAEIMAMTAAKPPRPSARNIVRPSRSHSLWKNGAKAEAKPEAHCLPVY